MKYIKLIIPGINQVKYPPAIAGYTKKEFIWEDDPNFKEQLERIKKYNSGFKVSEGNKGFDNKPLI